jgi:hypothetical protein
VKPVSKQNRSVGGTSWLGLIGAAIATPFCVSVSGYPMFHWAGCVALIANFVSAFVISRGRRDVAFAILVPFMMITAFLAVSARRGIVLVQA